MSSDPASSTQRDLDLVVFGATGFTGKFITKHIAKTFDAFSSNGVGRWAVAGRSEQRLQALVGDVRAGWSKDRAAVPEVVVADVNDPTSLVAMCSRAKLVINAVGPFRFCGQPVVKACVEHGADYVDITGIGLLASDDGSVLRRIATSLQAQSFIHATFAGEPEFFERMHHSYHELAQKKGVMIVHCCGFDSVPADLSVLYTKRQLQARGAVPSAVEMFFKVYMLVCTCSGLQTLCFERPLHQIETSSPQGLGGNYATYESAVYGIGNADELRRLRKEMKRPQLKRVGPPLKLKGPVAWDSRVQSWVVPFFFADPSVIRLTQCLEAELGPACTSDDKSVPPVQFAAYIQINSTVSLWLLVVFVAVFSFLATKPWGRDILLKHPKLFSYGIFSREGPREEQIQATRFTSRFFASGYSNEKAEHSGVEPGVHLVTECSGPEPGYVTTPICIVNCAYTILRDKGRLQLPNGVLTPAVAFGKTDLIERLSKHGLRFSVLEKN